VNSSKSIGMDVHTATISVAVRDAARKLIMESVIETRRPARFCSSSADCAGTCT
jgi:hypothetical protein